MTRLLIDNTEFQDYILNFILSGKVKNILKNMEYQTNEFEAGFVSGLAWASMLTTQLTKWELKIGEDNTDENKTS